MPKNQLRILIAEDNTVLIDMLNQYLERHGFICITATDGKDALRILQGNVKSHVDLALIDLHLPQVNGFELATTLHNTEQFRDIPMILMTQDTKISVKTDSCCKLFKKIFYKPIELVALLDEIKKHLST